MGGREDFEALLELLAVARNGVLRSPLSAVVDKTDHDGMTVSSKVHVEGDRLWSVEGDDASSMCDPVDGCVIRTGHSVEMLGPSRPDWMAEEIQLFYPLGMRIWGSHQDNQRIIGAERTETGIGLSMVYIEDEDYSGEGVFDPEHGW
ncbi:hypothetical protein ACWF5H_14890 [Arthrobacter sp. NPDC055138]